jgi:hypothetical protein
LNLIVIAVIILAVVAILSIPVFANAFTWYPYQKWLTQQQPQQFPPINQFPFNQQLKFPFQFNQQQFPRIIIPPIPPITFPNQFPFNFNGQPIPIPLPPIPPIQLPQQTQQQNSVSQNTQCNNGSCTTNICTNGACQTQTSTGSSVSVTTRCINGVCTTTFH